MFVFVLATIALVSIANAQMVKLLATEWESVLDEKYLTATGSAHVEQNGDSLMFYLKDIVIKKGDAAYVPESGETFPAHVHDKPCSNDPPAGGHWKIDANEQGTVEMNELWAGGALVNITEKPAPRTGYLNEGVMSVLIHHVYANGTNNRAFCAPLMVESMMCDNWRTIGTGEAEVSWMGSISITQMSTSAMVEAIADPIKDMNGNISNGFYPGHLHAGTCAPPTNGGGHWKINTTIDTTEEMNEVWLNLNYTSDSDTRMASDTLSQANPMEGAGIRLDAKSWVFHKKVGDATPKAVCCDFFAAGPMQPVASDDKASGMMGSADASGMKASADASGMMASKDASGMMASKDASGAMASGMASADPMASDMASADAMASGMASAMASADASADMASADPVASNAAGQQTDSASGVEGRFVSLF